MKCIGLEQVQLCGKVTMTMTGGYYGSLPYSVVELNLAVLNLNLNYQYRRKNVLQ